MSKRYQVTPAGEDDWKDVDADSARGAGEVWAEANWTPDDGETTFELDVKNAKGELFAVTVDVSVDVSFFGIASKHPGATKAEQGDLAADEASS